MFLALPGCWSTPPAPSPKAVPALPPTATPPAATSGKQTRHSSGMQKCFFILLER